jgi:flavin-binding protein dodecin
MSTYKVIELIGSSYTSWADAAKEALERASSTLDDLRVAEMTRFDLKLEDDGKILYRTRMTVSFKVRTFEKFAETLGAKPYAEDEEA